MKRITAMIMTAIAAVSMMTTTVSATEAKPTTNTVSTDSSTKKQIEGAAVGVTSYRWYSLISLEGEEGSTTYYTLDGSKPSKTNGFKYTKPFSVSGDTMIRFKTYKDGYKASKVYRYQYKNLNGSASSLVAVENVINPTEAEFKSYINALTLSPKKVNYKYIDNEIETILSQITTSKMTTYEKMIACYDWCVKNIAVGTAVTYTIDEDWSNYHSYNAYYAMLNVRYALKNRKGTCDNFSALYYAMLRRIGIEEAAWYEGYCATSGGGMTGHKWTGICMADNRCVMYFDPMLEYGKANRQYFARTYESSSKLYDGRGYYDNNSFGDFWRGEDAKADREAQAQKKKEEREKAEKEYREKWRQETREQYSTYTMAQRWSDYCIDEWNGRNGNMGNTISDSVYDYESAWQKIFDNSYEDGVCSILSMNLENMGLFCIDPKDLEFTSVTDCAEVKEIDGEWYMRHTKIGVVKIGYRPKGTNLPYIWYGYCIEDPENLHWWWEASYAVNFPDETNDEEIRIFEEKIGKYYNAPYSNWDLYPDEQWIENSDMIYLTTEDSYLGFTKYFSREERCRLTFSSSDPEAFSVWKSENGKLINVDTGEKKGDHYVPEGQYAFFPTDVKETGKTKADITIGMKGTKEKKVIHIILDDDEPAKDDGPQFTWGFITMPG